MKRSAKRIVRDLLKALRLSGTHCVFMNHPHGYEHGPWDICPCEVFVDQAIEAAEEWLKEVDDAVRSDDPGCSGNSGGVDGGEIQAGEETGAQR